ncbi:tyrosine-type recombinase/integrase [Brevundimonas sp. WCHBH090558]|uniref:tyrosine-type recombinase/integrase n=1 Tax=Brevundimonas huaxiensis TaxID=2725493 RepID=UPI0016237B1D|nr:tyrosine-type recombinase/integrase [Brevundimonas huaxiensis]MBC1183854.1 tyrosine-type recombinase/integrase [Brevundimonas huaxiensis]
MTEMATIELAYIQRFKDRHGRIRHYYRRKGYATIRLPGDPGSAEFMDAYAQAHGRAPKPDPATKVQPRSINHLMVEYYRSADFLDLESQTQKTYRNILDRFRTKYGARSAVSIEPQHLNAIFHQMADKPGAQRNLRKRLMKAFAVAVELGWRKDNPVRETKARKRKSKGFIPWSEVEIQRFEDHWGQGTRERLALYLLLYTGVRRSDVVGMGQQHVKNGRIAVMQEKTDVPIWIPIHRKLKAEIARHGKAMTFILTQYGKPFSAAGFTSWFGERARLAGVPGRTPHGLRKAAGRRLAEAGATTKEIAAVLGHTSLDEVETYVQSADQARLADAAIAKLQKAEKRTPRVKP